MQRFAVTALPATTSNTAGEPHASSAGAQESSAAATGHTADLSSAEAMSGLQEDPPVANSSGLGRQQPSQTDIEVCNATALSTCAYCSTAVELLLSSIFKGRSCSPVVSEPHLTSNHLLESIAVDDQAKSQALLLPCS